MAKVQPLVLLSFRLIFRQFQPGTAYESVAYKKGHAFRDEIYRRKQILWQTFGIPQNWDPGP